MEIAKRQYSGNAKRVIRDRRVVCHEARIDYRVYNKDTNGQNKLDQQKNMLKRAVLSNKISFSTILIDAW